MGVGQVKGLIRSPAITYFFVLLNYLFHWEPRKFIILLLGARHAIVQRPDCARAITGIRRAIPRKRYATFVSDPQSARSDTPHATWKRFLYL